MNLMVKTQREYVVKIGKGLGGLSDFLRARTAGKKLAVITDTNVDALLWDRLLPSLDGYDVVKIVVPAGESSKNINEYYAAVCTLSENDFSRQDTVLTFGGGVVGDLGAFVASTYMRGINLVAVPTSLLAMVDSSVGGKTAIDLPQGKNLVGTFYQPSGVYIDVELLDTLPEREIKSGLGEVIKYCFLGGGVSQDLIKAGISEKLIYECLKIKRDIVSRDEKEGGERKLLNLGHTVGHAIESLSNYTLSHGECVVRGMAAAVKVSCRLGLISADEEKSALTIVATCGHDTACPFSADEIIQKIKNDKKASGDTVDFVVIEGGRARVQKLTLAALKGLLV